MDQADLITATTRLSTESYLPAIRAHIRHHGRTKAYLALGPLMLFLGTLILLIKFDDPNGPAGIEWGFACLALGVIFLLTPFVFWPRQFIRQFRRNPRYGAEAHWCFRQSDFELEVPGQKSCSEYALFCKVREIREGLLIYPQPRLFYWLPKDAFASEDDFSTVVKRFQSATNSTE